MESNMREEFESWCTASNYTLRPAETNCNIVIEGDYGHPTVQIAWKAWQASRAALVVELPSMTNNGYEGFYSQTGIRIALDKAGIKRK